MRSPGRRRPRKETRLQAAAGIDPEKAAVQASYVISAEHKDYLTTAGPGHLRSDASACPRGLDFDAVEAWLKAAIQAGDVSADLEGGLPRYVWVRVDGRVYEARLSNSGLGQYKGYPLLDSEAPRWLK